ncbi:hypothetical protein AAMO2058_001099800 [Amorphochlora amoebiformis]
MRVLLAILSSLPTRPNIPLSREFGVSPHRSRYHVQNNFRKKMAGKSESAYGGGADVDPEGVTRRWLEHFVVGLDVCPWAARPVNSGGSPGIRRRGVSEGLEGVFESSKREGLNLILIDEDETEEDILNCVREESKRLLEVDKSVTATTLIIMPGKSRPLSASFSLLMSKLLPLASAASISGVQVVPFHPNATFTDSMEEDAYDYATRSPYPMLHLLRDSDLDGASLELFRRFGDVTRFKARNARNLRALGTRYLTKQIDKHWKPIEDANGKKKVYSEWELSKAVSKWLQKQEKSAFPEREVSTVDRLGEPLVRIPQSAIMSISTARNCPRVGPLIDSHNLTEDASLAVHLIVERDKGEKSHWFEYIQTLPLDLADHPLAWDKDKTISTFGSTPLTSTLLTSQSALHHDLTLIQTALSSHPSDALLWALLTISSRAFRIRGGGLGLVPWADMLNHGEWVGEVGLLGLEDEEMVLYADTEYAPMEQVFDSYGLQLTPIEIFTRYGFTTPPPHTAYIPLSELIRSSEILNPKSKVDIVTEELGLPVDSTWIPLGFDHNEGGDGMEGIEIDIDETFSEDSIEDDVFDGWTANMDQTWLDDPEPPPISQGIPGDSPTPPSLAISKLLCASPQDLQSRGYPGIPGESLVGLLAEEGGGYQEMGVLELEWKAILAILDACKRVREGYERRLSDIAREGRGREREAINLMVYQLDALRKCERDYRQRLAKLHPKIRDN